MRYGDWFADITDYRLQSVIVVSAIFRSTVI